jgi:hypothetical protein
MGRAGLGASPGTLETPLSGKAVASEEAKGPVSCTLSL